MTASIGLRRSAPCGAARLIFWLRAGASYAAEEGVSSHSIKQPSFSPNGSKIVFCSDLRSADGSDVFVVNADGSGLTRLTSGGTASHPAWSPDGTKIALVRRADDTCEVFTVAPDGTQLSQVTHTAARPCFNPDSGTYSGSAQVTITSPDTTIRYTTDGAEPTETSTLYEARVPITQSSTFKARAWKTGCFPSLTKSAEYVIE